MKFHLKCNQHTLTVLMLLVLILLLSILLYVMVKKDHYKQNNSSENLEQSASLESESVNQTNQDSLSDDEITNIISDMSLEEKVAQLFYITPESLTGVDVATAAGDTTKESLEKYPVGGIIYFSQNIRNEEQITEMISNTQSYSKIPLFIGVDEEGGSLVARIGNNPDFPVTTFPDMAEVGATGDPSKAYEVGSVIGDYLKKYGFNMDFAPDADVLTNPDNTAIGSRSFGSDASLVAQMVSEEIKGFHQQEIASVIKHFPGHGGTSTDTHKDAAVVDRSLEELRKTEFFPFTAGIKADVDGIMVGHLQVPQVISDDTPSSLSSVMITDILRTELGYDGMVITDSLSMEAITKYYTSEEAALMCIQAGADMILMPEHFTDAYQGILDAVQEGVITENRIDESLCRILKSKKYIF